MVQLCQLELRDKFKIENSQVCIIEYQPTDIWLFYPLQILEQAEHLISLACKRSRNFSDGDGAIAERDSEIVAQIELIGPIAVGEGNYLFK